MRRARMCMLSTEAAIRCSGTTAIREFVELPWRHGFMYTPPFWMFHQHFNTCGKPARYLACAIGSVRYPFISLRLVSNAGGGSTR